MDAVLVSMSCFNLLCEEADIRCGSDDVTVTYLLPNYHVYQELAAASTVLTTGKIITYPLLCLFSSSPSLRILVIHVITGLKRIL
jgi:neurofibromin 1